MQRYNQQTDKLTININHIDLAKIDLLVEQGFYSNRTDFIRAGIRRELHQHEEFVEKKILVSESSIGIYTLKKDKLERIKRNNEKIDLEHFGLLIISEDVSLELFADTINSVDYKGTLIASKNIKDFINQLNK
ncbi:CopG family transcriptional regulator [Facklamia sp. DSM 111018]|uniref:CopG family transcriptional regulator n=1 Tax=Facklamia lactis TaxID=2749967 RepID=A0ABS0LRB3_9LACT|nr:hypothetical protein [Facklamia lactis]MBG9980930.1 CopG family transcriptional regulator [Facklamia lactis]MBG9986707.1 CopG family transcriptional regulator [Facklamia lactis]